MRWLSGFIGVLLLACGGSVDELSPVGSGGSGATGCSSPPPECVPEYCGGDVLMPPTCVGGAWQCPADHVPRSTCPPDACFGLPLFVCCDVHGVAHEPSCPNRGAPTCGPGLAQSPAPYCPQPPGCELTGCGPESICTFANHSCGTSGQGACTVVPSGCDDVYEPVCGCDGTVYGNACEAHQSGVDLGLDCLAPAGTYACGPHFCQIGVEYCEVSGTLIDVFACQPMPPGCEACACLASEPCGAQCGGGDGQFKLSC